MREGIKTSLLSILCVAATAAASAAPAVRTIGGTGTYESAASAANATATSRAGSLRATGGFVRPMASVSTGAATTATPTTTTTATATMGGSVSTGGATVGRVASTPRLSIGKYIGAPKSISSSGGAGSDLTNRVEQLETTVVRLDNDKQDALQDSTYITIQGDELVLDLERIREDLEITDGTDGREVEMGTDDNGLLWRYVGDTEWETLITWDDISEKLDFDGIDQTINQSITNLRTEMLAELDKKVDKDQGTENAGKALIVNDQGIVEASDQFVTPTDLDTKVDKNQGTDNAGRVMVVNDEGVVTPSEIEFATTDDLDNLGALAYKDTVSTDDIDNKAVERAKLADNIVKQLDGVQFWEDWWIAHQDELASGDYVVAVQPGTRMPQLFRIITADDEGPTPTPPSTPASPDPDDRS